MFPPMRDGPRTAIGQLDASHHRHDQRLEALVEVAVQLCGGHGGPADLEELEDSVTWFARSVPRHFADEDDAVFPALAAKYPEHRAALAALSAEHPALLAAHRVIHDQVLAWRGHEPAPADLPGFLAAVKDVAARYRDHALREEALFSGLSLDRDADAEALVRMEAHRGR
jgi:iron-sulfur cluster repair protein YtfE (RIC family)